MGDIVLPPMDSIRASWWSITINNPTEEDRQRLRDFPSFVKKLKYQDEVGTEGTLHIQGAVNTAQTRLAAIKSWLPRAHIEVARDKQALLKYVEKSETAVPNTQVVVKAEYLTMEGALRAIALMRPPPEQFQWRGIRRENAFETWEYWNAVNKILEDKPGMVGLFTNPQMLRAWINTRSVWIHIVYKDRQTELIQEIQEMKNLIVEHNASSSDRRSVRSSSCGSEADVSQEGSVGPPTRDGDSNPPSS